jgi:hypothetical protein
LKLDVALDACDSIVLEIDDDPPLRHVRRAASA